MAEKNKLKTEDLDKSCNDIWNAIDKAVLDAYGCLLPSGEITITLELPWTRGKGFRDVEETGQDFFLETGQGIPRGQYAALYGNGRC